MTDRMSIGQFYTGKIAPAGVRPKTGRPSNVNDGSFEEILQSNFVRFSQHAEMRLRQRGIQMDSEQLSKLETAIDKAAAKGAKESLVLLPETALIVNIKNRMVVTAMDQSSMKDHVFTQIDSAIVLT